MAHENHLGKGVLIGFITGGALGAALALLYAPKTGKELRAEIRTKSDEYQDDAEKYIPLLREAARDLSTLVED